MTNGRGLAIAGRKKYVPTDFYQTPPEATEALLKAVTFEGSILEPACGLGAISDILKAHGYSVQSSDIVNLEYGNVANFYQLGTPVDNIVTNPPYNDALNFVLHSKVLAEHKIAMILKLSFLESVKRAGLFADTNFPLSRVLIFRKRVQMYPYTEEKPKNSSTITYAWFIWDKQHKGKATIGWL